MLEAGGHGASDYEGVPRGSKGLQDKGLHKGLGPARGGEGRAPPARTGERLGPDVERDLQRVGAHRLLAYLSDQHQRARLGCWRVRAPSLPRPFYGTTVYLSDDIVYFFL